MKADTRLIDVFADVLLYRSLCLIEAQPSPELLEDLLVRAEAAAAAWGDAVPATVRERAAHQCARRLSVAGLIDRHVAA